ncbi:MULTISPECIES: response regulator transcription factor [Lachnospiraceae]|uniref:Stage 0 sporulation protein A homolog n=1 Tax=Faecalicatena acetigenes TaxID=2981790 RepID=A0ABT2T7E8_9FIRM|nr:MULTISPECIES: response regulator transcription factor [Lachnospiraceae]MCU6746183.1 response regulator transcription factor [Faecalicatena acetigenes]SCH00111.1 Transcriptional regulatory protein CseB [uncultured Clostridium sp.]
MEPERILLIEDDEILAQGVKLNLSLAGFAAETANTLKEGEKRLLEEEWDLLLLDVNLPDGDGFSFAGRIRKQQDIPIIFLTAKDMDTDMMTGFENGADDYVTKPFHVQILIQRIRAVLNRYTAGKRQESRKKAGNLEVDLKAYKVWKKGEELILTPTEFKLLRKFLENPDIVLTRGVLLEELWDKEGDFVDEHTLTIFVSRLRSKIADEEYQYIQTIYGTGYQWSERRRR